MIAIRRLAQAKTLPERECSCLIAAVADFLPGFEGSYWFLGQEHLNFPAIAETEHRIALGPNRFHLRRPGDVSLPQTQYG